MLAAQNVLLRCHPWSRAVFRKVCMRSERPRSGQSKRLGIERLEDRSLMAGNVTAAVQGGFLVITGDAADNGVTVDYIQATNSYQVIGTTPSGGTATTINGLDTTVPANAQIFTNVTKGLKINTGAGNDLLVFGAATSSTFVVVGTVEIDTGLGNDTVNIGRNGNAAGGAAPIENEVNIGKSLAIKLGGGNDTLTMTNMTVANALVVHADNNNPSIPAADGQDSITFPTTFTPAGGSLQNFPVTVGGKTTILLGGNVDTLNMLNFTSNKGLLIGDNGGNLNLDIVDSRVGGELKLQKNGGATNAIDLDNVIAGTVRLNTGNGVDTLTIRDSIFERLYIDTAGARDFITIGNTRVRKLGIIEGGREKANLTQEAGNNLNAVAKRRVY